MCAVSRFNILFVCICLAPTLSVAAGPVSAAQPAAQACDPAKVMGVESCVKCHASEMRVWQATPHSKTFDELHRRPEAKQIAAKLGLRSIKNDGRCVKCHYTQQSSGPGDKPHVIAGVSCESCHGAAKDWLTLHNDYGGPGITKTAESPAHRQQRLTTSIAAGMRNPSNVFAMAQSCLRCHTTGDEELVNVGGHPAGSLDFELVSWSQGMVRHNFLRTDGASNTVSPPERLRVMFVAGMIAELEASMRATGAATQKATYGITSAQRAARAGGRLKSVAAKVQDERLDKIIAIFDVVTLKLNNQAQLTRGAEMVAALGYSFAADNDGSSLTALDPFIPGSDRWK